MKFFGTTRRLASNIRRDPDQGRRQADHGLLTSLTRVPLATEVFVVDDGSTDDTVEAVQKFRGKHDNVYLLRDGVSKGAGRARSRAAPFARAPLRSTSTPMI